MLQRKTVLPVWWHSDRSRWGWGRTPLLEHQPHWQPGGGNVWFQFSWFSVTLKPACRGIPPLPAPSDSLLDKYPLWYFDKSFVWIPIFLSSFQFNSAMSSAAQICWRSEYLHFHPRNTIFIVINFLIIMEIQLIGRVLSYVSTHIHFPQVIQVNKGRHVFANSPLPQSSLGSFSQEVSATNLPGIFSTYLQIETNWDISTNWDKFITIHNRVKYVWQYFL